MNKLTDNKDITQIPINTCA